MVLLNGLFVYADYSTANEFFDWPVCLGRFIFYLNNKYTFVNDVDVASRLSPQEAARKVSQLKGDEKIELFCFYEECMNPHKKLCEESAQWAEQFAKMCGFMVASCVTLLH